MIGLGRVGRFVLIGLPFSWLGVFFLLPLLIVVKISLAQSAIGIPSYTPLVAATDGRFTVDATLANFALLVHDDLYLRAYVGSLGYAAMATLLCLLLGFPLAHAIVRAPAARRNLLLFFVVLPFWTSFLIRVYAWIAILQPNGLLNRLLLNLRLIHAPLPLLNNGFSIELGLVYSYLPFMILPIYGSLSALDESLIEAAADLGEALAPIPCREPAVVAGGCGRGLSSGVCPGGRRIRDTRTPGWPEHVDDRQGPVGRVL